MANDTFNGQAFGAPPGPVMAPMQLQTPGYHCAKLSQSVKPVRLSVNGAGDSVFTAIFGVLIPGNLVKPGACFRVSSLYTLTNSVSTKAIQHTIGNVGSPGQSLGVASPSTADEQRLYNHYASGAGDPVTSFRGVNSQNGLNGASSTSLITRTIDTTQDWYCQSEVRWTAAAVGEFIQLESFLFELWP